MKRVIAVKEAKNSQATGEEKNSSTSFCATLAVTSSRLIAVYLVEHCFQSTQDRL